MACQLLARHGTAILDRRDTIKMKIVLPREHVDHSLLRRVSAQLVTQLLMTYVFPFKPQFALVVVDLI